MNVNYYNPYVRDELYHHGIAGMKWGKRYGPPYPLSVGAHSAAEKKANWRQSLKGGAANVAKAAKAVGRGVKKGAQLVNKGLLRANLKPRKLMSDQEIQDSINRLKKEKELQRALQGNFSDVTKEQQQKGDSFTKDLMKEIGKQVIIPQAVGMLNYHIAKRYADENTGEINKLATIMGKRAQSYGKNRGEEQKKDNPKKKKEPKQKQEPKEKPEPEAKKEEKPSSDTPPASTNQNAPKVTTALSSLSKVASGLKSVSDSMSEAKRTKADNKAAYSDFLSKLENIDRVSYTQQTPGTSNSLRKRTALLNNLALNGKKQTKYKVMQTHTADLNKRMTSYHLNGAKSLIVRYGKEPYSDFITRLADLDDLRHSYSNNFYNPYVRRELELYHHGIMGMRWGRRNGPPYPIAPSDHSASEKKAGWRDSLDKAKSNYSERKASYKSAKVNYKQAKKNYKTAERDLSYAKDDTASAKAKLKEDKANVKEAKRGIPGGPDIDDAKAEVKNSKYEFDRAKFNEGKMRDALKSRMNELNEAKNKVKAEKVLMREGKKALNEAKAEYKRVRDQEYANNQIEEMFGPQFNKKNAARDAYSDVNRLMGGGFFTKSPDGQNLIDKKDMDFKSRNTYDQADSLFNRGVRKSGGTQASAEYAKEYSKQFDEAVKKIRSGKLTAKGKRRLAEIEAKKPSFVTENGATESRLASRVKQMRAAGKTYAQISNALNISESSVGNLLSGKFK